MTVCCVNRCKPPKDTKVQTFAFPSDTVLRLKWNRRITKSFNGKGIFRAGKHTRICQIHFTPEDFKPQKDSQNRARKLLALKNTATPSLYLTGNDTVPDSAFIQSSHFKVGLENEISQDLNHEQPAETEESDPLNVKNEIKCQPCIDYQEIVDKQHRIIQFLKKSLMREKEEFEKIAKLFNPDQVKKVLNPEMTSIHWSEETMEESILMFSVIGTEAYSYLQETKEWPLPSKRTLLRHIQILDSKAESESVQVDSEHVQTSNSQADTQLDHVSEHVQIGNTKHS